jgi:hypothetical protein
LLFQKLLDFIEVDRERWKCDRNNTAHPRPLAGKEDISHPCDRFPDTKVVKKISAIITMSPL